MPLERQPWDGVERRTGDAGVAVTSLKVATRAAEGTPLDAEAMFRDAGEPNLNHVRTDDLNDKLLRCRVGALLRTAAIGNAEVGQYLDGLVDTQFNDAMDTLKVFNLYNTEQSQEKDVPAPTLEQAKEILAGQITPEQLEVIKRMEKPTLQLIPVTSMARYAEALNSHKPMDGQIDAHISDWHKRAFGRADKRDGVKDNTIIGWKIAVTEGAKEPKLLDGDNFTKKIRERDAWFKQEFGSKGVNGVDLKRMLVLMMEALKRGEPLNDILKYGATWTFVNEESEEDGHVSGVLWLGAARRVGLGGSGADARDDRARFRSSVVVDVPKTT